MYTQQNYRDFLRDDDFILWRLTGNSEHEACWAVFQTENPALRDEFEKAIKWCAGLQLNAMKLTDIEAEELHQRIRTSIIRHERKLAVRRFLRYAAAACFLLVLLGSLYVIYNNRPANDDLTAVSRTIVGENLEAKDITLMTDDKVTTFGQDIRIKVDESGQTTIRENSGRESTLSAKGKELNKLIVPYGKRSQLELSDGTKVWLNSGSTLEFPAIFAGDVRTVNLTGEMYIEVAKGNTKPFCVKTADFLVKVYGTTFNISAYGNRETQSVVLVEGKVSVKAGSEKETVLEPNEMLTYQQKQWTRKTVDVAAYLSWKDGIIQLDNTPISEVLRQVERYYNLSFNIDENVDLASKTCSGKIYLSDNLDDVMRAIAQLSSTRYSRNDKTIYIEY